MSKKKEGQPAEQRFRCSSCGTARDPDDRFCRQCGASFVATGKKNGPLRGLTGLRAFGLAVIALAALYALIYYGGGGSGESPVPAQRIQINEVGAPGIGVGAPLATPLQTADQLFNDAMTAYETGDSVTARQFIPMALMAYQRLDSLSLDARYHVALLSLAAGRPQDALAQTDTMLARVPNHLLALSAAAQAQDVMGRTKRAIDLYRRFLDAYTPDVAASRSEYIDHGRALTGRRDEARAYLHRQGVATEGP